MLRDLNLAEAKGTGIRSMRRLAAEAGLTLPEFQSKREADTFCVTLFLHNLLTEDDHAWLRSLATEALDADEVKVLIYARATGAVDNTACRDFSGLDTLTASRVLRRLRDRGLLQKQGSGNATYYTLNPSAINHPLPGLQTPKPDTEPSKPSMEGCKPSMEGFSDSHSLEALLSALPRELAEEANAQRGKRQSKDALQALMLKLCGHQPFTAEALETLLDKHRKYLMTEHIRPLVQAGKLRLLYPESAKHPHQAYVAREDNEVRLD